MKLELYHFESCPFCKKVSRVIDELNLRDKITFHDTLKDTSAHQRLVEMIDDEQVPCLVIDGKPMLESDEIIAWLRENLAHIRKS